MVLPETRLERDLRRLDAARDWFAPGLSSWHGLWEPLYEKVQAAREAKGLLPFPYPPIPRGTRGKNEADKLFELFKSPGYGELSSAEQHRRICAICRLEPLLELLSSPAFDKLSPGQQVAALFAE